MFRRLGFVVAASECEAVALCEPGAVERVLKLLRARISDHAERQRLSAMAGVPAAADSQQTGQVRLATLLGWPCPLCIGCDTGFRPMLHDSEGDKRGSEPNTKELNRFS